MNKALVTKVLYFFYQTGCDACEEAAPALEAFRKKHHDVLITELNLARKDWVILGWSPRGTPGYLLSINGQRAAVHVGVLTLKQLEKFYQGEEDVEAEPGSEDEDEDGDDDVEEES